ncbi:MAG TPA: DUF2062 domain-containing protein [Verrucomicrobiae bacterium]
MFKKLWLGIERSFLFHSIRLFRIRGQNERVARGFALGLIVNLFPTFGFGVLISGLVAKALGGNAIAGVVGGATLTFVWPLLFYINMRVGGLFTTPPVTIDELSDVSEKTVDAMKWGHIFMIGALINSLLIGGLVYLLMRLLHWRIRPHALEFFRRHARDHQKRFRRPRLK